MKKYPKMCKADRRQALEDDLAWIARGRRALGESCDKSVSPVNLQH